jgi:hypothetical protein
MPTVIERIQAGLDSDTPSRVEWRTLLETALFEIERLTAERDEWKHKWMGLAQASLLAGTMRLGDGE